MEIVFGRLFYLLEANNILIYSPSLLFYIIRGVKWCPLRKRNEKERNKGCEREKSVDWKKKIGRKLTNHRSLICILDTSSICHQHLESAEV